MKTPSQRRKGKKKQTRFKTQAELDKQIGFDPSFYFDLSRHYYANRVLVNSEIEALRKQFKKDIKNKAQKALAIEVEKKLQEDAEKQARKKMKEQTVFDVIDIDD